MTFKEALRAAGRGRTEPRGGAIFMTGATGLLGSATLERMLAADPSLRVHALVRSATTWSALADRLGAAAQRVTPFYGDVVVRGLGLTRGERATIGADTRAVLHLAADTTVSNPIGVARAVNRDGTAHVVELANEWTRVERFAHVSTAFVAGRATGTIAEAPLDPRAGWVNAYEQSKYEAEHVVRSGARDAVVFRPSTIACESSAGVVRRINPLHCVLNLCHAGLAPVIPGRPDTPVDVVTTEYVAGAIAALALRPDASGQTYHLCAGAGALPLGELIDRAFDRWNRDPAWQRRGVTRPALTDLAAYRAFEADVHNGGDEKLRVITRALSPFVPQLALPKRFDTSAADAALGYAAPRVREYWDRLVDQLTAARWRAGLQSAA